MIHTMAAAETWRTNSSLVFRYRRFSLSGAVCTSFRRLMRLSECCGNVAVAAVVLLYSFASDITGRRSCQQTAGAYTSHRSVPGWVMDGVLWLETWGINGVARCEA